MEWLQHLIVLSSTAFLGTGHSRPKADAAAPGLIADAVFDGQLAVRNFERDYGAVEKEFYIKEIISLE